MNKYFENQPYFELKDLEEDSGHKIEELPDDLQPFFDWVQGHVNDLMSGTSEWVRHAIQPPKSGWPCMNYLKMFKESRNEKYLKGFLKTAYVDFNYRVGMEFKQEAAKYYRPVRDWNVAPGS